ncbi:MAG TPA: glycosyltransferase family 39 protein [Candidatus Methylomirabilis sp.]|nr:glycosyltransferase family 39 protein [Candidatus Methylomirabilis sp.]
MHYVAWMVAHGAVPYRDAFDMNMPGAYLIHRALLFAAGPGDLAWRLFDLAWLTGTCGLLFRYGRRLGDGGAAAMGALLFALYHLSGGAWRVGQRDFLLCTFLLGGALGVARSLEDGGALRPLVWAGLALGAGTMVKPQAGLYWLACMVAVAWGAWHEHRSVSAGAAVVLGAGLLVPALVFGWLAWRGGLGAFVSVMSDYVLPLYSHVGRVPVWRAFSWYRYGQLLWSMLGAIGLLAMIRPAPDGAGARKALAVLGVGYGWLHFAIQGKGWEYHLYPLALFICALAPFALARAGSRPPLPVAPLRGVALVVVVVAVVTLGAKGVDALDAGWIAAKSRRVAALARDLAPLVPAHGTVQVMDVTEGGLHALLRLGIRQPTRFLYDFHFFHDQADPRIQALQREFVAGLEAGQPAAIVVMRDTWNQPGYERLQTMPRLTQVLDRAYTLAVEGDGYRIYAKRARP